MTGEDDPAARVREVDEMIDLLGQFWREHPYLRLGQMISNGMKVASPPMSQYEISDARLMNAITRTYEPPTRSRKEPE